MSDLVVGLIRTWVPILVGAVISWLIAANVIDVDAAEGVREGLVVALTALSQGVYYTLVRLVAERWPSAGVLLGVNKAPTY